MEGGPDSGQRVAGPAQGVLKDEEEDAKQGTTAFDLLTQFSERFQAISGNLITRDSPFASAGDFTADIARFMLRTPIIPGKGGTGVTPKPGGKSKLEINDDRLVRSMDNLAATFERGGW